MRTRLAMAMADTNPDPQILILGPLALCVAFLKDNPLLSAVYAENKDLFKKYCICSTKPREWKNQKTMENEIEHFWWLLKRTLIPCLASRKSKLITTEKPLPLYRGIQAKHEESLEPLLFLHVTENEKTVRPT